MAATATNSTRTANTLSLARSILTTGIAIGIVGGIEYIIFYFTVAHTPPEALYQFIASGLLGPSAFAGGYVTALVGVLLHFGISIVVAGVFLVAAARLTFLRRTVFLSALVYGCAVNVFMSVVVMPHSALRHSPTTLPLLLNGLIGSAFFIGVPLIVTVRRHTQSARTTPKAWLGDTQAAEA